MADHDAPASDRAFLDGALAAARWIGSAARTTGHGLAWLPDPDHPDKPATVTAPQALYSGGAGIVLFLLELAQASGDAAYLDEARRGADELAATWREALGFPGMLSYTNGHLTFGMGLAGTAFALTHAWLATGEERYRTAAAAINETIAQAAQPRGDGVVWTGAASAGLGDGAIVLYLLWAARALDEPALRELAIRAGAPILDAAEPDARGGLKWVGFPVEQIGLPPGSYMPNFEFGTAGVAYVLARLYEESGDARFLEAARAGASHIQALATLRGDAALLFYREPDLTDLYYLGYCHGPVGTARTFYQLYRVTGEADYLEWTERFARGVSESGIPDRETPGLWNVVCQCCGTTGVSDFFLSMWLATGREAYLAYARRVGTHTLGRASAAGDGLRWYQAWTRTQPDALAAETGYMIGAASVGSALLHLHLAEQGRYAAILFPDNPFPGRQAPAAADS